MTDTFAASFAFLAAGLALLTLVLPWPRNIGLVIGGIAILALIGLGLRRHGYLDRAPASTVAVIAGTSITLVSVASLAYSPSMTTAPSVAGLAGVLVIVFAYADGLGITRQQVLTKLRGTSTGLAIGFLGLLGIFIWGALITSVASLLRPGWSAPPSQLVLSAFALALGIITVTGLVMVTTDRGLEFIDYSIPTPREWGVVLVGLITILAMDLGLGVALRRAGFDLVQHGLFRTAGTHPTILLVLIPLSFLLVGPSEELLYRNIIQKLLYESFSRPGAILVASAIFATVHVFAFLAPDTPFSSTLATLLVVFVLSIILGLLYEQTNNVVVPAIVHGSLNAVTFAASYLRLTGP